MGNALGCMPSKKVRKEFSMPSLCIPSLSPSSDGRSSSAAMFFSSLPSSELKKKKKKDRLLVDDSFISKEALASALLFHHHQLNGSLPFPRSNSLAHPSHGLKKHRFIKSSSSSQSSLAGPLVRPSQLVNQDGKIDGLETNHFVLVHGGGFGAWCWYKTITLLEEAGFTVDAVNLTVSGVNSSDTNAITSLAEYVKPLTDIFHSLGEGEKVILVGHDFGGACISYLMESFPSKIAKAVFVTATMLSSGQSALDIFSQQTGSNNLMQQAQIFVYANGKDKPPTAIKLDKSLLRDLLFNQSSTKDIALASVSMRPIPFAPVLEKLSLSNKNYGSIQRFYIKTQEDSAIPVSLQESMIRSNLPDEQVFLLKGSDHAPFFSKPQALHRILMQISQIPSKQQ